jgi:hypothetical protein
MVNNYHYQYHARWSINREESVSFIVRWKAQLLWAEDRWPLRSLFFGGHTKEIWPISVTYSASNKEMYEATLSFRWEIRKLLSHFILSLSLSLSLSLNWVVQFSFFATKHIWKTSFMLDNEYYMANWNKTSYK